MVHNFQPRDWQERFVRAYQTNLKKNFLLEACISAGKTAGALYLFELLKAVLDWGFLVVVVPSEHLKRQYAQDARKLFGLTLYYSGTEKRLGRIPKPEELLKQNYQGIVISYHWLTNGSNAQYLAKILGQSVAGKILVILDEVHHASEKLAFGQACETAFPDNIVSHRLMTSGTPFRSDNKRILGNWLSYEQIEDNIYQCQPDFRYSLADALRDGIIPIFSFVTMEGEFDYRRGHAVYKGKTFTNATTEQELVDALNTAIHVEGDWVKEAIEWAYKRIQRDRNMGRPECAAYIRVSGIPAAWQMKERIRRLTGEDALVVVSKDEDPNGSTGLRLGQDPSKLIEQFASETGAGARSWIIGVGMLGEGVSIHRLKYRIHATNFRTPLSFIQDLGRLLRLFPEDDTESVETLIPAHPMLISLAINILNEIAHVVQDNQEEDMEDESEDWEDIENNSDSNEGDDQEPILSNFIPLASTGILGNQIVDGEEIPSEYANVAEWAIENHLIFRDWPKTPAHLAQKLMQEKTIFEPLYQAYQSDSCKRQSIFSDLETNPPTGFASEYADFLADDKVKYARKQANKKAYRLACLLYPNNSEDERQERVKEIHTSAKLKNKIPVNGFINHEGWENICSWLDNRIVKAQEIKGIEDL